MLDIYTTWTKNDVFKERETYMYLAGGKRWVGNNLALVLFKHQWLNGCLHNVTYVNGRLIQIKRDIYMMDEK